MKKGLLIFTALVFLWITGTSFAGDAPHQVSVFKLNSNIADVKDYVIMETALPIRYMENIEEVEIKPIEGLKSGLIAYATCAAPGHIVRIKLKYKDASRKFYDKLLKQIKKKFGDPEEFTGDAFGIVLSWKWRFRDKDNNYISLTLQHNKKNQEETMGNMVKLAMPERIEAERNCFLTICETEKIECPVSMMSDDWDHLIPK